MSIGANTTFSSDSIELGSATPLVGDDYKYDYSGDDYKYDYSGEDLFKTSKETTKFSGRTFDVNGRSSLVGSDTTTEGLKGKILMNESTSNVVGFNTSYFDYGFLSDDFIWVFTLILISFLGLWGYAL